MKNVRKNLAPEKTMCEGTLCGSPEPRPLGVVRHDTLADSQECSDMPQRVAPHAEWTEERGKRGVSLWN
jgi:hypothetical protein